MEYKQRSFWHFEHITNKENKKGTKSLQHAIYAVWGQRHKLLNWAAILNAFFQTIVPSSNPGKRESSSEWRCKNLNDNNIRDKRTFWGKIFFLYENKWKLTLFFAHQQSCFTCFAIKKRVCRRDRGGCLLIEVCPSFQFCLPSPTKKTVPFPLASKAAFFWIGLCGWKIDRKRLNARKKFKNTLEKWCYFLQYDFWFYIIVHFLAIFAWKMPKGNLVLVHQ